MPKTQTSTWPFLAFDNNLTGHIYIIWPFQKLKLSSKKTHSVSLSLILKVARNGS